MRGRRREKKRAKKNYKGGEEDFFFDINLINGEMRLLISILLLKGSYLIISLLVSTITLVANLKNFSHRSLRLYQLHLSLAHRQ